MIKNKLIFKILDRVQQDPIEPVALAPPSSGWGFPKPQKLSHFAKRVSTFVYVYVAYVMYFNNH